MNVKNKLDKILERYEESVDFVLKEANEEDKSKDVEELPKQKGNIEQKIIAFFSENENPSDKDIHSWSEKQGISHDVVEEHIYKMLTKYVKFLTGGLSVKKGLSSKSTDASELKMGIEVEKEHTTDIATAERIALDHLAEIPDYYTRLKKMEDEALGTK